MSLAAFPDQDFSFTPRSFQFTDVLTIRSLSSNELVVSIIDVNTELFESFTCTLQARAVRGIEPNQVTIRLCDDDSEHIHIRVYTYVVI